MVTQSNISRYQYRNIFLLSNYQNSSKSLKNQKAKFQKQLGKLREFLIKNARNLKSLNVLIEIDFMVILQ